MGKYLLLDETKTQFIQREAGAVKTSYIIGDNYQNKIPLTPNGDGTYSDVSGHTFSGNGGAYYIIDEGQPYSAVVFTNQVISGRPHGGEEYNNFIVINFVDGTLCGYAAVSEYADIPIEMLQYYYSYLEIYTGTTDNLQYAGYVGRVILLPWSDEDHVTSIKPGVAYVEDTKEVFYNGDSKRDGYVKCTYYLGEEVSDQPKHMEFFEVTDGMYFGYDFIEYGVESMLIDGTEVTPAHGYDFPATATGFHEVWFKMYSGMEPLLTITSLNPFGHYHGGSLAYSVELPEGVEAIPFFYFAGCVLRRIVIPSTVKWIAPDAFSYVPNVSDYKLPVTLLGSDFINHSNLNEKANNYWGAAICEKKENGFFIKNGELFYYDGTFTPGGTPETLVLPSGPTRYGQTEECSGNTHPYGLYPGSYVKSLVIPDSYKTFEGRGRWGGDWYGLSSLTIGSGLEMIGPMVFNYADKLEQITCHATTAPTISNDTFKNVKTGGTLHYPSGSDYSSWMQNANYYLGNYGWTSVGDA